MTAVFLLFVNLPLLAKPLPIQNGGKIIKLLPSKSNIYYDLSYEDGLKQVVAISRSAKFEDCWIYIDKQRRWYDVGINGDSHQVSDDLYFLESNPKLARDSMVTQIHIHPDYSNKRKISIPSYTDVNTGASYIKDFREMYGARLINMVADGFGIWEFYSDNTYLNKNFREKLDNLFERFCCEVHGPANMSREQKIERIILEFRSIGLKLKFTKFK